MAEHTTPASKSTVTPAMAEGYEDAQRERGGLIYEWPADFPFGEDDLAYADGEPLFSDAEQAMPVDQLAKAVEPYGPEAHATPLPEGDDERAGE